MPKPGAEGDEEAEGRAGRLGREGMRVTAIKLLPEQQCGRQRQK